MLGFVVIIVVVGVSVCLLLRTPPATNKLPLDKVLSAQGTKHSVHKAKEKLRGNLEIVWK